MGTTVYLIRHGQSLGNERGLFLGQTDLDLTPLGYEQARRTAAFLQNVPLDAIYSSDLKRAYNTALATAEGKDIKIAKNPVLREIYAGAWEGKAFELLEREYAEDYGLWQRNIGLARCTEGESVLQLQERFVTAVKQLARAHRGQSIAIFTHATPIRTLKAALDGKSPEEICRVPWPTNASVTRCELEGDVLRLREYSRDDFMAGLSTALPANV